MSTPSRSDERFRPELEGLRGVAILLVVACHAAIPGAEAGFIGVDLFFVLSGFLITGLLITESERTGSIHLAAFYARRARRILPAAAVVLVVSLLAARGVMSPLDLSRIADDGLAAGLSLANIHFAVSTTDYFAPVDPSPLLHFWSLSLEEQFYLFWPALLIVATRFARPRRVMIVLAGIVLIGGLLLCIAVTVGAPAWAYYALPTRAWQLAAGGVLALAGAGLTRIPWPIAASVGWFGAGMLVLSMIVIEPMTPYPGVAAAAPTAGALALIAAGAATGSPGWLLLRRGPMRWLGRISYSLYLWHWPVLVLGVMALAPTDLETTSPSDLLPLRLVLVGLAVVIAALSWRFIEEPFRAGRLSHGGRRRVLAMAVAALLSVTVTTTALSNAAVRDGSGVTVADGGVVEGLDLEDDLDWPTASPDALAGGAKVPAPPAGEPAPSTPTADPGPSSPAPAPTASPAPRPKARLAGAIPAGLTPSLSRARKDEDRLLADGCALGLAGSEPPDCTYGDPGGAVTVALVGDSHAMSWFPAFERLATRNHWRLVPFTKFSCVFVDLPIWSPNLKREYTECEVWRTRVVTRLRRLQPDIVVISSNKWLPTMSDRDGEPARQGRALAALIDRIPGRVAILVDTPRSQHDVPACLAAHPDAIQACTTSKAEAFGWRHRRREVDAAKRSGAAIIDLSKQICPTDPCPPIIGKRLVYRDHHHLTATFALSLTRDLDAALRRLLP